MDLTIPYTFYPLALPHWIAWILFSIAMLGGAAVGVVRGRKRGWPWGLLIALAGWLVFLFLSMLASMLITFFVHDL
jgi:hypothetical protein